jgi:hypothetical protein
MAYKRRLGEFVREFKYDGVTFFVRGLTVGEYADLASQGSLKLSKSFYTEIAVCGIMGWEGIGVPYEDHMDGDWIDDDAALVAIGKYIYHNLTILQPDVGEKFRGFIRFLYWSSGDDNESQLESFNCDECLDSGRAVNRPCGKYDMEYRRERLMEKRQEGKKAAQSDSEASQRDVRGRSKYRNQKLRRQRTARRERKAEDNKEMSRQRGYMMLGGYKFPECPISWIDEWVKVLGEAMYHSEKSELPFFSGGIADQPYRIFRASKVVKGEYNSIEQEELEKERNKNK